MSNYLVFEIRDFHTVDECKRELTSMKKKKQTLKILSFLQQGLCSNSLRQEPLFYLINHKSSFT